jgi:hypothetical protein
MANQSAASGTSAEFHQPSRFALHRVALTIMWLLATGAVVVMLWQDVRHTDQFSIVRYVLQATYVLALLWYLGRTGPSFIELDELTSPVLPRWRFGPLIPVLGIVLVFALTIFTDDGVPILMLLLMIATVWILVVRRREIRWRLVVAGLAVAIISFLGGYPAWSNGLIGEVAFVGLLVFVPPMFVAGVLLIKRTGLGGSQLQAGRYRKALESFLWGCLLFVPLGMINAASGSPGGDTSWVTGWWMPLSLPFFSGIAEEAWFRLLLVGLCYLLLRPACRTRPALAVLAAMLFSAITFGLGHGRTLDAFLTTGLLYGLPMAVVFAKRDWEHAIGAHYMINMISWVMAFLEN